ncbi:MAG: pseudaminic acid synthase, partial [Deferribacterales bacterium]
MKSSNKVFIIAELSANHNQDLNLAKETIHAIKESGADAVKL